MPLYDIVGFPQATPEGTRRKFKRLSAFKPKYDLPVMKKNNSYIHPTASIDDGAEVGGGTQIWHFSHVRGTAKVGENCVLGQNVYVDANVKIGNNVHVQNNVSVYEGVVLEDDVFCGPSMVFTNVKDPRSGYPKSEYGRTVVRKGATLGANCTVVCGIEIGQYAFVAAGSVVTKDVPKFSLVGGVPARVMGYVCKCGMRLKEVEGVYRCGRCKIHFTREFLSK